MTQVKVGISLNDGDCMENTFLVSQGRILVEIVGEVEKFRRGVAVLLTTPMES
jgi:hypothetical protein